MKSSIPFARIFGFFIIFCIVFSYSSNVFSLNWSDEAQTTIFYEQPENSIDVLFLGASGFFRGVSPLLMWEQFGFTSYVRAMPAQQADMVYYYFLESLNYQKPKVVVLDAYRLVDYVPIERSDFRFRRSIEPLRFSVLKLQAIYDLTFDSGFQTFLSFLFPILRYHTRWTELTMDDLFPFKPKKEDPFKGQGVNFIVQKNELPEDYFSPTSEIAEIRDEPLRAYEKIIQKCRENDIEIFLMSFPRVERGNYPQYLAVTQFAEKHNLPILDFNLPELIKETGHDPATDMIDDYHINTPGSTKFINHIGTFIVTNYGLKDKRQNPDYEQWNIDAELLLELISTHRE